MSLIIDDKLIETSIEDLLSLLQQQLAVNGVDLIDRVEIKQGNARIRCPFHSEGKERTPSCDILLEDKHDVRAGSVHCFGCGYRASFVRFVSDVLNCGIRKAKEWVLNVSTYSILESRRELDIDLFDDNNSKPKTLPYTTLEELKKYDYIHEYMFKRKLTPSIIDKFEVGYDPKSNSLTFPVYENGNCLFVAKRRVDRHWFEMPQINPKPIYGLDYITGGEVIVCESIINALTCYVYGRQAIALFGTGSESNYATLNSLGVRHYILMFDGDEAGRKGAKRFKENVHNAIVTDIQMPLGKDVNDLTQDEFNKILSEYSV